MISTLVRRSAARLRTRITLALWVLFSVAATVMAPFQSSETLSWSQLAIYWAVVVGLALLFSAVITEAVALALPNRDSRWNDVARIAGMCVLFTPVLYGWTLWMTQPPRHIPSLGTMMLFVALIGVIAHSLRRILRAEASDFLDQDSGSVPLPNRPEVVQPRLMRRLPEGMKGPILRLSASDHFVEVHLPNDTHILRMRFTDAIAEMDGVPGDCAHRSHWVTFAAITGVTRQNGRIFLEISNGDQVPVSRTYKSRIEDAGFL